jgi:hypothetical protein
MLVQDATVTQLHKAAKIADVQIIDCRSVNKAQTRYRFRLGLSPTKRWRALSRGYNRHDRPTHGVCFHGHLAFFRCLFEVAPKCKVQSMWLPKTEWYTEGNHERLFDVVGDRDVGPPIQPIALRDCCRCRFYADLGGVV